MFIEVKGHFGYKYIYAKVNRCANITNEQKQITNDINSSCWHKMIDSNKIIHIFINEDKSNLVQLKRKEILQLKNSRATVKKLNGLTRMGSMYLFMVCGVKYS